MCRQSTAAAPALTHLFDPSPGILPQAVRDQPGHRSTPVVVGIWHWTLQMPWGGTEMHVGWQGGTIGFGRRCADNLKQHFSQFGGQMTSELSQRSVTQSSPCSGEMQSPVAQWHPVNVPSQTTAYAYL